jgi:hypothetical protein
MAGFFASFKDSLQTLIGLPKRGWPLSLAVRVSSTAALPLQRMSETVFPLPLAAER